MRVVVVIPTYNEADNIEKLVEEVFKQPLTVDILIVDDNSPDGTGQIADRLVNDSQYTGRVNVLHRANKEGLGRAYVAGFGWALEHGYDAVVEMDADFSHDPMYLKPILDAAQESDVVIGSRYIHGISVMNWPLQRILLSWGANRYVRTITRMPVFDCTSGFRLYKRDMLESIHLESIRSNGYSFQVEVSFRAFVAGFSIVEVPIIFTERRYGQSKMSKKVIMESVWIPVQLRFREGALRKEMTKKKA
jgi:dolichol-phosphate mannosyltransferase